MASYKYQQNDFEGASVGYVRFDVSPDLGVPIAPGETLTVTGQVYHRRYAHACLELALRTEGRAFYARVNQSFPKGRSTGFTLTYTVTPEMAGAIRTGRTAAAALEFTLWRGADGGGTGDALFPTAPQALLLLKYRLEPVIAAARFARCREGADGWEAHDEGMYARAEALRAGISPSASAADVTVHRLEYTDAAGEARVVELAPAALLAGYAETAPGLLAGERFLLGRDGRITVVVGDAYDTARATVVLPRAYTNFHQSGAIKGGAAFGMFSGSTDGAALLESAYPFHGYGGVYGADGARLDGVTEWQVDSFGSQFAAYSAAEAPRVLRSGRLVQLSGACAPRAAVAGGADEQLMFTLPRRFWPRAEVCRLCPGTGAAIWLLRVSTDGLATMSRYRSGASYAQAAAGAWLRCDAAWVASDYTGPAALVRPARAMRTNSHQGCLAAASSVYSGNYPAWRAFDYKETTGWASLASDQAPWLQLRLDIALKNIVVRVYARDTAYIENPTAGRVLGSEDGSAWTELGRFSGWSAGQSGGLLGEVACAHETPYRYVRLAVDARSHANTYVAVGYMEIRGEVPEEAEGEE